ncbi:EGF domain-specific O-linked N-acetylglucosamine transferase-like [Actinia tenebrosa]|uniref:EGF domain-specific O-linked N-acetylglucosamine transferase n=1 Tax=Actinia tenebrosa TaxID=6105 RepID=A0A6P8IAZ3_ACTTE|nr:EGF domain-specific O-linked N-acetylglucosamine transferase-like [Actinia tenebrosa]
MKSQADICCRLLHSFTVITLIVLFVFLYGFNGVESLVEDQEYEKETKNKDNTCKDSTKCKSETMTKDQKEKKCWGYEPGCKEWFITPKCNDEKGWRHFSSNEEKVEQFWKEADFGYVKNFKENLQKICKPLKSAKKAGSSFACTKHLSYCKAKNLYMDLRDDGRPLQERFKSDMFKEGQLGGFCKLDSQAIQKLNEGYNMELTSWLSQIEKYTSLPFNPIEDGHCDVVVERPTIFMKLDAVVNMYHHFCDFFNLFATLHVNGSFSTDINIVLWESYARYSLGNFQETWKVFTKHPILYLGNEYGGKRVCFKRAIFALLPRMVFGLYYNTPLIPGCSNSGLFKAFSEHVLSKLDIKQERTTKDKAQPIRVTFLSRGTKYRDVLNQDELVNAAKEIKGASVKVATYTWDMPFLEQLKVTHNSDIFIGMHGAGLAHALFLPDWALLFELYNCEDPNCYRDLARLRGLSYLTWEKKDKVVEKTEELHPRYPEHPKFRNYEFDVTEFKRLLMTAVNQVRRNLSQLPRHQRDEL